VAPEGLSPLCPSITGGNHGRALSCVTVMAPASWERRAEGDPFFWVLEAQAPFPLRIIGTLPLGLMRSYCCCLCPQPGSTPCKGSRRSVSCAHLFVMGASGAVPWGSQAPLSPPVVSGVVLRTQNLQAAAWGSPMARLVASSTPSGSLVGAHPRAGVRAFSLS
jgi:hypothetical protein